MRTKLEFIRIKNNLKQGEFAKILGCSSAHYSNIKHGTKQPSNKMLANIYKNFSEVKKEWLEDDIGIGPYGGMQQSKMYETTGSIEDKMQDHIETLKAYISEQRQEIMDLRETNNRLLKVIEDLKKTNSLKRDR